MEDATHARESALRVLFSPASNEIATAWTDSFPAELGYRIEKRGTAPGWQSVATVPASANTGETVTWSGALDRAASYRVVALRDGYVVPLETEPGVTTAALEPGVSPAIRVDQPEPLRTTTARLSISGIDEALSVWYVENAVIIGDQVIGTDFGTYTNGPDFATAPRYFMAGQHRIDAFVTLAPGVKIRLTDTIDAVETSPDRPGSSWTYSIAVESNDNLAFHVSNGRSGSFRTLRIYVNGSEVPLTYSSAMYGTWTGAVGASAWPNGTSVTVRFQGTHFDDTLYDESWPVVINRAPQVTVETPFAAALVQGTLHIKGSVTDDSPSVTTTVSLDDTPIFQTQQPSFDQSISLADVPIGPHELTISAVDSDYRRGDTTRTVVVMPVSSPFTYHKVFDSLPLQTQLLDSEGTTLLYRTPTAPDAALRVIRRTLEGSETVLQGSEAFTSQTANIWSNTHRTWDLAGSRVAVGGLFGSSNKAFVYDATGVSQELPYGLAGDLLAGLQGDWVIWGATQGYLRNLAGGGPDIGPIDIGTYGILDGFAFAGQPGSERLFFSKGNVPAELNYFDVASGTTTQVTAAGGRSVRPQTDGTRVAWERWTTGNDQQPYTLMVAPVANPSPATSTAVSTQMREFRLADGTLAWTANYQASRVLIVDDASGQIQVSEYPDLKLLATSAGNVLFIENDMLYVWSRADGKRLLLPAEPGQYSLNGNTLFFATTSAVYSSNASSEHRQAIYRVDL